MAKRASFPLLDEIRGDAGVRRLIRSLGLASRFYFYMLVCDTPKVANAVFEVLAEEVPVEREKAIRIIRLDPYRGYTKREEPIPFTLLVDKILARLVWPKPKERAENVIFIVDASRALERDDDSWNQLFQRMNERRNVIADGLQGQLVLCLPGRLEPVFAHAAPDFWSIRSMAVLVKTGAKLAPLLPVLREEAPRELLATPGEAQLREAAEIEAGIEAARAALAKSPEDESALKSLIIWLDRQVNHELERGTLDRALRAAEENVALWRQYVERNPTRLTFMRDLSVSLNKVGDVHLARGDLDLALRAHDESLALRRNLLEHDPTRHEFIRDLSSSLERVGDVRLARGDLDLALRAYDESLALRRNLLERDPTRPEAMRDLFVSLSKVGDVYRERGQLRRALDTYGESFVLNRKLLEHDPTRYETLRDFSVSLDRMGDVYFDHGDFDLALRTYDESLALRRNLLERDPTRSEAVRDLFVSLDRIGNVHRARGDLDLALRTYDESLALSRNLLERDPTRPQSHHDLAVSLEQQARIAEDMGKPAEALHYWRQALAEYEALSQRPAAPAIMQEQADVCRANIARLEAQLEASKHKQTKRRRG